MFSSDHRREYRGEDSSSLYSKALRAERLHLPNQSVFARRFAKIAAA